MDSCQIELKDVSVTPISIIGEVGFPILKNASLQIHKGEWITVIGHNGSGKSTLAKVIAGSRLSELTGRIIRKSTEEVDYAIPIVMQQPEAGMVGATPWEDIVVMLEQHGTEEDLIIDRAEEMLHLVGLGQRMHQAVETLSGGQKQLVAIAGCLAVTAPLLILDEVTAMLDPEASAFVLEQVRALHEKEITVIWITQKLEELRSGDRILALKDGSIVYDGHAEGWFKRSIAGVSDDSYCEKLGFAAPYVVQTAWELESQGIDLHPFPITAEQLAEAVGRYVR